MFDTGREKRWAFVVAMPTAFAAAYAGYHLPEHHPHDVVGPWIHALGAAALCFSVVLAAPYVIARFRR